MDVLPIGQLRSLVERMQEGAVTFTRNGNILYCNARFAAMVGLDSRALSGTPMQRFLAEGVLQALRFPSDSHDFPRDARPVSLHANDGRMVPASMWLEEIPGDVQQPAVLCATFVDLTAGTQRGLQEALDSAGMGSWELYPASGMIMRSTRHDQIFGYQALQPSWNLETTLQHCIPEDRAHVRQAFVQARLTGALNVEARIGLPAAGLSAAGETRWVHLSGRTYYEGDTAARIAGVIADVTDRHVVEERLRQTQKIEALGQLAGGVAHDFNNLLQVISAGLQVMGKQRDQAQRDRISQAMRQAVERGAGLCRQLLTFSRRQALQPAPVGLKHVIEGMRELLDHSLLGQRVQYDFQDGIWPVEVDAGELELVILNLAVNARDALANGGTIRITARNVPAGTAHDLEGDFVRLDVQDNGTGMPPEVLAHAFEPFFTTKEVGRGSGLGLAQAHGFARASGGMINLQSAPDRGTTVSLFLPRTLRTPSIIVKMDSERASDAPGAGQVLLVEDDDEVAALTVEMIKQLGYEPTRVASAEAALGALADRRSIDIVFSDVMMPGCMNGVQLAQEIRRRRPNLPVLLTSGYVEAAGRNAIAPRIKIIPKPYRMDQLRDALAAAARDARTSVREH